METMETWRQNGNKHSKYSTLTSIRWAGDKCHAMGDMETNEGIFNNRQ